MRHLSVTLLGLSALASVHCADGSSGINRQKQGSAGTTGAQAGTAGTTDGAGGMSGMAGTTATGGSMETGGTAGTGTGGTVTPDAGGTAGDAGTVSMDGGSLRHGPFKMIVLSTPLVYTHDSIPTCLQMLIDLGKATVPERAKIAGLAADSTWTVDQIGSDSKKANYFSEVTPENLKNYELFYSDNPTGAVFSLAPDSAQKKTAFVDYWTNGGSWAGQHSATDFEKNGSWAWFQDNIDGAWFVDHDPPATNGTVIWQPDYVNHPILKGLTSPWSVADEWYLMNRNVEAVKGFHVLAKVTVNNSSLGTTPRPAVWITENAKGGRAFYTIRGHDPKAYAEPQFRELMLRGILWSVHRLPGE